MGARVRGDGPHRGQLTYLSALLDGAAEIEGLVVDTELRWAFLERLVATGVLGEPAIAAELERDRTAAGERHAATARAARPTAEAKAGRGPRWWSPPTCPTRCRRR